MNLARFLVLVCFFRAATLRAENWKPWPPDAGEHGTTIGTPPGFTPARWRPSLHDKPWKDAPQLLSGRFRSKDGRAEFGVVVYYVRGSPNHADGRRINVKLEKNEKLDGQKSSVTRANGENGPYWIYEEETTISGPGYTRYRLNSFSTSSLPGAASVFWEFQVADEAARKRFTPLWKKFKATLEVEED